MAVTTPAVPRLPAVLRPWPREVLTRHAGLLHELSVAVGGPYHVLFPEEFDANLAGFRRAIQQSGVDGFVYLAKKANKAASWVRRCAETGAGVDVASLGELRDALAQGVRGEHLVVTGPAKSDELLGLAVLQGCLVAVDSTDELERYLCLAEQFGRGRLLLRCLSPIQQHSRFGLTAEELQWAMRRCAQAGPHLRLEGFSVHLSGYDLQQRADAAAHLIHLCERARQLHLPTSSISIGGGFPVDYVGAENWHGFCYDPADFHAGKGFSGFYPYHAPVAGADALRAILAATPAGGTRTSLAELLRAAGIRLLVEPGRALLDQAGCTVFRVQGVKSRDYGILTVDGTSLSLSEQWFDSEFLPDPILLAGNRGQGDDEPFDACVGGASCLESDMLTWRKVRFPTRPLPGDLLVYPNTAGYQMDSNESEFHARPLPPKLVLSRRGDSVTWRFDRPIS